MLYVGLECSDPFGEPRWRAYVGDTRGCWHTQRWRAMRQLHEMIGPVGERREPWRRGPDRIIPASGPGRPKRRRTAKSINEPA